MAGTWVIPGHGRLLDAADVASYRNMVVIIRDRDQNLIEKPWTREMFIEAVYRSLQEKK